MLPFNFTLLRPIFAGMLHFQLTKIFFPEIEDRNMALIYFRRQNSLKSLGRWIFWGPCGRPLMFILVSSAYGKYPIYILLRQSWKTHTKTTQVKEKGKTLISSLKTFLCGSNNSRKYPLNLNYLQCVLLKLSALLGSVFGCVHCSLELI